MSTAPQACREEHMSTLHPCVSSIPGLAGPCFKHPYPSSLRKTLSWVVAISTSCRWGRFVTASIIQWWWREWSWYLLCAVITQTVTTLSKCLWGVTTNKRAVKEVPYRGEQEGSGEMSRKRRDGKGWEGHSNKKSWRDWPPPPAHDLPLEMLHRWLLRHLRPPILFPSCSRRVASKQQFF